MRRPEPVEKAVNFTLGLFPDTILLTFKMPTFNDITTFLGGQIFGQMSVPEVDLSGKTLAVTGANTGLGLECVKHL